MAAQRIRTLAAYLAAFIALTAIPGGVSLITGWIDPGVSQLAGSPFADYTVPGLLLLLVVGGLAVLATGLLLLRSDSETANLATAVAGAAMVAYECVEWTVIGFFWLQAMFIAIGLLLIAGALAMELGVRDLRLHRRQVTT